MTGADPQRDQARAAIRDLVAKYESLSPAQRRAYNETPIRNDFIDPLFEALGWNIHDNAILAREDPVVHRKRVDYAFKIRNVTRFLLEAKRPRDSLDDIENIRQATDYAWNQGVDWVALCNFDELRVFYASHFGRTDRYRPVLVLKHDEYDSRLEDLWLLSRPATESRELARQMRGLPRRQPVDTRLFKDLAEWRRDLLGAARDYNEDWTQEHCEEAVQRILNRLIFIRCVEDRGIENTHLVSLAHELRDYPRSNAALPQRLVKLFRKLDEVYNARLFAWHFSEDYVGEAQPLVDMVKGLDHRVDGTTYDFSAIGADVLGTIYEQYLTQVQAERERRKQQGIYYTPRYVVSYIVRNTLNRALEAANERGGLAAARQLRVLDPACGSGSFLIAAFDILDDWLKQHDETLSETATRRQHILRENLFGVDLDPQAVEVTRLNLWLRAVDARERLPDIPNIREGNSLIEESFDWHREFPQVFERGGFDVVVGNPPYVRQESLSAEFKLLTRERYRTSHGFADIYVYFYERAHELLRPRGYFGFISSNKFMRAAYGAQLRRYLLEQTKLQEIIDFGRLPVFRDVAAYPAIVITKKRDVAGDDAQEFIYTAIHDLEFQNFDVAVSEQFTMLDERSLHSDVWALAPAEDMEIFLQMRARGIPLKEYLGATSFFRGLTIGLNDAFIINKGTRNRILRQNPQSALLVHPLLLGKDIHKYQILVEGRYLINIPKGWTRANCGQAEPETWMREQHPLLMGHLDQFEERARRRLDKGEFWWELRACAYLEEFSKPKIIFPDIARESRLTLDTEGFMLSNTCYFIPAKDCYLLGILNSRTIFNYFKHQVPAVGGSGGNEGGWLRWIYQYVSRIPIVRADSDDPRRMIIERNVREALELAPRHAGAMKGSREHEELGRRLAVLDAEIDEAVCALYGLTDAQKARVLGSA